MSSSRYFLFALVVVAGVLVVPALVIGVSGIYNNVTLTSQPIAYQVPDEMKRDVLTASATTTSLVATTTVRIKVASTSPSVPLIASPADVLDHQEGKLKILLLGTDERGQVDNLHTDTIVLIIIDKTNKRVSALSFPRDLFVRLPDGSLGRINNAYQMSGFSGLGDTLLYNFGISVDHFALTNFTGFKKLVDDLGGVDVKVGVDFADWRAGEWTKVSTGVNHFNGTEALWYARSRETSNDLDRNRRTQEVITAVWNSILSSGNITKIPELYQDLQAVIKTDMQLGDIVESLRVAGEVGTDVKIKKYTFGVGEVAPWTVPTSGAMVLLPKREEISMLISRALGD
ncbi:MAG: LCP family protein [bacterium]